MQSGGLDASYALLSDVSARNRALQARLQSSLPLLWRDNALVLTNVAPRRRRATGISSSIVFQSDESGEADRMLMALEETTQVQTSRRYRRRVEWEVARRIARVDRELHQYPPAQRFWNKKRVGTPPSRQHGHGVGKANARANTGGSGENVGRRREVLRSVGAKEAEQRGVTNRTMISKKAKPTVVVKTRREKQKELHGVSTSPRRVDTNLIVDKENETGNLPSRARIELKESPSWETPGPNRPLESEALKAGSVRGAMPEDDVASEERTGGPELTSKVTPVPSPQTNSRQDRVIQPQDDEVKKEDATTARELEKSGNDDGLFTKEWGSPRQTKAAVKERPSSSIGRQVLSEYRTMPSVASFGAQPVLSAGGPGRPGNKRLNADVLRRLFSDLDTDHDGHVNRIETCMALHRLQISVPTTKIISFFRHIHSPTNGKSVRSHNDQHLPLKEVINYKEFVAFVTTAYDHQQQQRMQRKKAPMRHKLRSENHDRVAPSPLPSMSLPICTKSMRPEKTTAFTRQVPNIPIEYERRLYELHDGGSDQGIEAIEERVIRSIPDFLVRKMLAGTDKPEIDIKAKETAVNVVRKSLESLVGTDEIDDKTVIEIAQELLTERLQKISFNNPEDTEDVTGLRRAAAYYSQQVLPDGVESYSVADDSNPEDFVNWAEILTEEQVSSLVQQIWKDRTATVAHAPPGILGVASIDNLPDLPEEQTSILVDAATDPIELSDVPTVSEKAIQATSTDMAQDDTVFAVKDCEPTIASDHQATHSPQAHLGRAFMDSANRPGGDDDFQGLLTTTNPIQIVQQLRRTHPIELDSQQTQSFHVEAMNPNQQRFAAQDGHTSEEAITINTHPSEDNVVYSSEDEKGYYSDASEQAQPQNQDTAAQNQHLLPLPTADPAPPLMQKMLDVDKIASNGSSSVELEGQRSSFMSSSASDSTFDDHHVYNIHREIGQHHRHARFIRRQRHHRRRDLPVYGSLSGSSVPDSICSAELSEGELDSDEALELSDGEIFGECKRKYLCRKNAAPNVMSSMDDSDGVHSSVESGELPVLMNVHTNFRRQIFAQSTSSSIESGEVEDGAISDCSESLPMREN